MHIRKMIVSIVVMLCCVQMAMANVVTGVAAIPDHYYDAVDGKKGADNILTALNQCVSKGYHEINYKALEEHYLQTDFYADTLWDMYSTCRFTFEQANIPQKAVCDGWNKEHVCCQSWLGSGPMVSDMFNVYPTDARVNNLRSNYPYGVVGTNKGISGDPDHHALGKLGSSTTSRVETVYEPDDRYKGDFARTFFYMVARYRGNILNNGHGSEMFTSNPTNLTNYSLSFLLDWHRNDPVSEKEIDRNQGVYGEQNNRNPFIDYPDLVEYIWGTKVGQAVDLASMTPTCEGGGATPVGTVKYGVTWIVNGEVVQVDSVRENGTISALPETPASCSEESESFYCWCGAHWDGTLPDYLPDDAITVFTVSDMPIVNMDVTYYAVFAHKQTSETGGVESHKTIVFKDECADKQEVSALQFDDITLSFSKGTASQNVPKYYANGESVRCYAGNTMTVKAGDITSIAITFGSGDSNNAISVNTGTLDGSTWTGNADEVVFTIGGSSGNRRFAQLDITRNGQVIETEYTNFITSCEETDIDSLPVTPLQAMKILRDGQLLILRDNRLYTLTGQEVR